MPGPRLATLSTSGLPHFGHSFGGETKADRNSGSHHPPADWIRRATSRSSSSSMRCCAASSRAGPQVFLQRLTVVAGPASPGLEKDPAQEPDEHQQTEGNQNRQRTFEERSSPTGKDEDRNQEEDQPQDFLAWICGTSRHDWDTEDAYPGNLWRPFFVQASQSRFPA
jgi:hypothetical protein